MSELSAQTLVMTVQAVDAEIRRIKDSVNGDITKLEADVQEVLMSFSQAAMELKGYYIERRSADPGMPPYEQLVADRNAT